MNIRFVACVIFRVILPLSLLSLSSCGTAVCTAPSAPVLSITDMRSHNKNNDTLYRQSVTPSCQQKPPPNFFNLSPTYVDPKTLKK